MSVKPGTIDEDSLSAHWRRNSTRLIGTLAASFGFRLACFAVMLWLALWAESRPASGQLPDTLLSHIPYLELVDRYNYWLWVVAYIPVGLLLMFQSVSVFTRYMVTSGLVTLIRGLCIVATGLGPVRGADLHAGMSFDDRWHAFLGLAGLGFFNPDGGGRVYLTKDLFFSGHTATTFILLLYVWRFPKLRAAMLVGHFAVVASVFFAHLHYTIDVIGAYAISFSLFVLREGNVKQLFKTEK